MQVSDLNNVLHDTVGAEGVRTFFDKYSTEYEKYRRLIGIKGTSIRFDFIKDEPAKVNSHSIIFLCECFLNGTLSELELNFMVDNIIASGASFEDDLSEELLEELTDPEINGALTKSSVNVILDKAKSYVNRS